MLVLMPMSIVTMLGLAIGSFLNVVAHRVPLGLSVVRPASACPGCSSEIAPRDNVPVVSWLLLRGRCRTCGMPISARYPLVELMTAIAFALVAIRFVPPLLDAPGAVLRGAAALELVAFLYLAAISVALVVIDIDVRRLPDRIVLPAYAVGVLLLGGTELLRGDIAAMATAAIGSGASIALYFALAVAKPGGMGLGDVKLAGVLGLFAGHLGVAVLVVGTFAAFFVGAAFGVTLILMGRAKRGTAIPFGPWMILGTWTGVFFGAPLATIYLSSMGLF